MVPPSNYVQKRWPADSYGEKFNELFFGVISGGILPIKSEKNTKSKKKIANLAVRI
jgi:hypothetical protein